MGLILLAILLPALVNGVTSSGLSVIEVNEKNNVHHLLHQGDIVLSREHAEQVASGTKDAGGNNEHRLKRQAMNWKAWPQMLWIEGLNYVFDDSISDQTKNAFRDAAKQWESQTCINFTENPSAKDRVKVTESSGCWSSAGQSGDFMKYTQEQNDNFGLAYDYGSIMHYAAAE
ncbi:astacin [Ostertagia ostertagi]